MSRYHIFCLIIAKTRSAELNDSRVFLLHIYFYTDSFFFFIFCCISLLLLLLSVLAFLVYLMMQFQAFGWSGIVVIWYKSFGSCYALAPHALAPPLRPSLCLSFSVSSFIFYLDLGSLRSGRGMCVCMKCAWSVQFVCDAMTLIANHFWLWHFE